MSLVERFVKTFKAEAACYNRGVAPHYAWVHEVYNYDSSFYLISEEWSTRELASEDLDRRLRVLLDKVLGTEEL